MHKRAIPFPGLQLVAGLRKIFLITSLYVHYTCKYTIKPLRNTHTNIYIHIYTHIHTHTYIYIYIYVHTHTQRAIIAFSYKITSSQYINIYICMCICVKKNWYIYIYIPAFNLGVLEGLYWVAICFIFVCQLDASWGPLAGKSYCYYSKGFKCRCWRVGAVWKNKINNGCKAFEIWGMEDSILKQK